MEGGSVTDMQDIMNSMDYIEFVRLAKYRKSCVIQQDVSSGMTWVGLLGTRVVSCKVAILYFLYSATYNLFSCHFKRVSSALYIVHVIHKNHYHVYCLTCTIYRSMDSVHPALKYRPQLRRVVTLPYYSLYCCEKRWQGWTKSFLSL